MPELTLTGMRVVYEVGTRGSFTAAARALGYTQSGVSRQVGLAEQALGVELFERLSRGVRPTARGEVLIRHAKSILERVDSAMLELEELGQPLSERLVLGAFPTALAALVPRALATLRAEHPALEVRISEGGTEAQLRRLRAGRIAIAVIAVGFGLDYDLGDLEVDLLLHGTPRLIVSAHHRFAERSWVNVAELRRRGLDRRRGRSQRTPVRRLADARRAADRCPFAARLDRAARPCRRRTGRRGRPVGARARTASRECAPCGSMTRARSVVMCSP